MINFPPCKSGLAILCCSFLISCGGGDITSGFDIDFCDENEDAGTWEGTAQSGLMSFNLTVGDEDCELRGAAVYGACVPVTAINGTAGSFLGWSAETVDGSLAVGPRPIDLSPILPRTRNVAIGTRDEKEYVFVNTQNRPNCPQSETGIVILTKVS